MAEWLIGWDGSCGDSGRMLLHCLAPSGYLLDARPRCKDNDERNSHLYGQWMLKLT